MKKILNLSILLCLLNFGCTSNTKRIKKIQYEDSLKMLLIGEWGERDSLNQIKPFFKLDRDSIYYLQSKEAYAYKLDSNNILSNRLDYQTKFEKISIRKDTMTWYDGSNGLMKAYRINRN